MAPKLMADVEAAFDNYAPILYPTKYDVQIWADAITLTEADVLVGSGHWVGPRYVDGGSPYNVKRASIARTAENLFRLSAVNNRDEILDLFGRGWEK